MLVGLKLLPLVIRFSIETALNGEKSNPPGPNAAKSYALISALRTI